MATTEKQPKKSQKRREVRRDGYREIAANDMFSQFSPWDFVLTFGNMQTESTPEELVIDELVKIHVSPQFMVRILQTMEVNIAKYESQYGKIQMPKGIEKFEVSK
jgi:hypothetical protein